MSVTCICRQFFYDELKQIETKRCICVRLDTRFQQNFSVASLSCCTNGSLLSELKPHGQHPKKSHILLFDKTLRIEMKNWSEHKTGIQISRHQKSLSLYCSTSEQWLPLILRHRCSAPKVIYRK
jgi:hypothetical protein